MNISRSWALSLIAAAMVGSSFGAYNVRRPSDAARPRWSGAKVGEWTMDYQAARSQAVAEGKSVIVFTTGSWWCPHCEAFEEKVLLENAAKWNAYVQENGFYLVMLDFPYRLHVKDDEIEKSTHPEFGDGWGFKCWLYDDEYLAENKLSKVDGLNAIMDMYRIQQLLALPTASPVSIKSWDGKEDFNYGKVGYPTLIVFLPDGSEAGRFSPGSTNRTADDAYNYVAEKIDAIMNEALEKDCGLCSEPEEWGLPGKKSETYRGWLRNEAGGVAGAVEIKTGKKNAKSDIKITAKVTTGGKTVSLSGLGHDCCIDTVTLVGKGKDAGKLELMLSENGLTGEYIAGDAKFAVTGARDVFKAKDSVAKSRAKLLTAGTWTMAMSVLDASGECAGGYGAFSVKVSKNGTAKLTGKLPDGTSVSLGSKAIVGDSEVYCIPFSIDAYRGKKGGLGFNLWFKNGWLFNVNALREWTSLGACADTLAWRPIYSAVAGVSSVKDELELVFRGIPETIGGQAVVSDPDLDSVVVKKNVWKGTEASEFSAKLKPATGLIDGKMKFFVKGKSREVGKSCKVSGVVVDGTAYCSVQLGKEGNIPLKISSCDACED